MPNILAVQLAAQLRYLEGADVVFPDVPVQGEVGAGFVFVSNTCWGRRFLDLVLEKRAWSPMMKFRMTRLMNCQKRSQLQLNFASVLK